MIEKLKPCPCCSGSAFVDLTKSPMGIRYYSVICKDCGLGTKHWCENSKQKAYDSWNTRAHLHTELVEALEDAAEWLHWLYIPEGDDKYKSQLKRLRKLDAVINKATKEG